MSVGTYEIEIVSIDGSAKTKFSITSKAVKPEEPAKQEEPAPTVQPANNGNTAGTAAKTPASSDVPRTGDDTNVSVYMILSAVSLAALILLARKKQLMRQ